MKQTAAKPVRTRRSGRLMGPAIWSGCLQIGRVAIPVQLRPAIRRPARSTRWLHDRDRAPLERRLYCPVDRCIIKPSDTSRGYEWQPGYWVAFSDSELASISPDKSRGIRIAEFVPLQEIAPVYFDRPYYLWPIPGARRAYRTIWATLKDLRVAGIAQFVLRDRERLCAVHSADRVLCVMTLRFHRERAPDTKLIPSESRPDAGETLRFLERVLGMPSGPK